MRSRLVLAVLSAAMLASCASARAAAGPATVVYGAVWGPGAIWIDPLTATEGLALSGHWYHPQAGMPDGLVLSADGNSLYAHLDGGGIGQYDVQPNGDLVPKSPEAPNLTGTSQLVLSPTGDGAYMATSAGIEHVGFGPDATLDPATAVTTALPQARPATALTVSPDGRYVYAGVAEPWTNPGPGHIDVFEIGPGGQLTLQGIVATIDDTCPYQLAVSPDEHSLYAVCGYAIDEFDRAGNGSLHPKATPSVTMPTVRTNPCCEPQVSLGNVSWGYIVISPDGQHVYSAGGNAVYGFNSDSAGELQLASITPADGADVLAIPLDGKALIAGQTSDPLQQPQILPSGGTHYSGSVAAFIVAPGGPLLPNALPVDSTGGETISVAIRGG